jgi:hypothetical protein
MMYLHAFAKGDTLAMLENAAGSTTRFFLFFFKSPVYFSHNEADEHVKNKSMLTEQTSAH